MIVPLKALLNVCLSCLETTCLIFGGFYIFHGIQELGRGEYGSQTTCCSLNRSCLMYTGNKTTLIMFETPLGFFLKMFLSQAIDFILECGLQVLWCDLK